MSVDFPCEGIGRGRGLPLVGGAWHPGGGPFPALHRGLAIAVPRVLVVVQLREVHLEANSGVIQAAEIGGSHYQYGLWFSAACKPLC